MVETRELDARIAGRPWTVRRWAAVHAVALGATFGLLALVDGTLEALGFAYESLPRDLGGLAVFVVGGTVFAHLRQRTLRPQARRAGRVAVAASLGLAGGFVVGFLLGGPPLDFVLSLSAVGALAGAVEWRALRAEIRRPGVLTAVGIGGWLVAGIAGVAPAALLGDAVDAALGGGTLPFVLILGAVGLVGGAVGGALEGLALRSRLAPHAAGG